MKFAYNFIVPSGQKIVWAKSLRNKVIPPSKSILLWKLLHSKMATDEVVLNWGVTFASQCSMCLAYNETMIHLFCSCSYAQIFWNWLSNVLQIQINSSDILSILQITQRSWPTQVKVIVPSSIIFVVNSIWKSRNHARYDNKATHWRTSIKNIISLVFTTGNTTKETASSSIEEFRILKAFKVLIHPPKAPTIQEVFWTPPKKNLD